VGKVGDDLFGRMLRSAIEDAGIDSRALVLDGGAHTTLAFVQNGPEGEREFSFYRDPGADELLRCDELPVSFLQKTRVFHFGSLSLTREPARCATQAAVETARKAGAILSFDPNLRPNLWSSLEQARAQIAWGLGQCDVLKIADNELRFMTGESDFDRGAAILQEQYPDLRLLNVTAGAEGSYSYYRGLRVFQPGFRLGGVVDTTGAGDTFCACVLHFILEHGLDALTEGDLAEMLRFANAAAYLVTTKKGAIRSMPAPAEIQKILGGNRP
jgi:fructokinase